MESPIYQPSDDSYLLSESIKKEISGLKNKNITFLEIGIGSGIQLETTSKCGISKKNIYGVDINNDAVLHSKEKGFNAIKSNLFSKIPKSKKFDFIVFNPPYLPYHKFDNKPDTSGGKKGDEIILKFLSQVKFHLKPEGKIFLLTSSFTPMERINKKFKYFKVEKINEKNLFHETLYIWRLELKI